MENEKKDVKPEPVEEATPVQEENQQAEAVSEDEKTPSVETVDKSVYESVREALKREREEKKAKGQTISELEARLSELETRERNAEVNYDYDPQDAKVDILFAMNKDSFVKDNLDLIEEKMSETKLDFTSAVREVKAEFFDRIQKETSSVEIKPPKQEKTTATQEETPPQLSGDLLNDAMSGKIDVPQEQLIAMKRVLGR